MAFVTIKYVRVGVIRTAFYTFIVVFVALALHLLPKVLRLPYVTPTSTKTGTTPAATPSFFAEKSYFCDSVIVSCIGSAARCFDLLQPGV